MAGTSKRRRAAAAALTLAEVTLIALAVWWVGGHAGAFTGAPKGYDATGHLSKASFVLRNWPHVAWNDEWYSGEPAFSDYPAYHVVLAMIAGLGHIGLPAAMSLVAYVSMVCTVLGLYGTVRGATGSRVGALVGAGFLLATPTLWAQVVVLGLYPRFAALGMMSVALAAAVAHSRRGGRWRGALTCVLLALSLSMHPVVGMIAVGLVAGVYLLDVRLPVIRRVLTAGTVIGLAFGLDAYFYVPLGLGGRSQTLFTDHELSLSWGMIFHPMPGHLDGLTPTLVPLTLFMVVFAVWRSLPPGVPLAEKVALGRDITFLTADPDAPPPASAGPAARRYHRWRTGVQTMGLTYRLTVLFGLGTAAVFAYGFVGLAVPNFPFYVNGLQPYDLLVYPAYLLSGVVGLMLEPLRLVLRDWLSRALPAVAAMVSRVAVQAAVVVAAAALIATGTVHTAASLTAPEATNGDVPLRAATIPAESAGQTQYRFSGASDSVTKWVNEYSAVPQTRGYDDHAALHLDWQVWLETSLLKASQPAAERRFLLDWYAVKWVDADAGSSDMTQYDDDPATFTPLNAWVQPGIRMQTYRYEQATPVLSASNAAAVLIVGSDQDYDLTLRAIALSGVRSTELVPVHGPASLDDVTPAMLASFPAVALYGATVEHPAKDAAVLGAYVRGGGGLFVDGAENSADVGRLIGQPGSPLPVAKVAPTTVPDTGWAFTTPGDPTVVASELGDFGPPAYGTSGGWLTETASQLAPGAHQVLATDGRTVAASAAYGKGHVFWEGLNLPFHLDTFKASPESQFLVRALLSTAATTTAAAPTRSTATYVNPMSWRISTSGARGVLFKEQDAPGWHATANGKPLTTYAAGPGMVWVPLASGDPVTVALRYRLSVLDEAGYAGSVLTVLGMAVLLASGRLRSLLQRRASALLDGAEVGVERELLPLG